VQEDQDRDSHSFKLLDAILGTGKGKKKSSRVHNGQCPQGANDCLTLWVQKNGDNQHQSLGELGQKASYSSSESGKREYSGDGDQLRGGFNKSKPGINKRSERKKI